MPFFTPVPGLLGRIERFVVLMFENRSFDHLLGYENQTNPQIDGIRAGLVNYQVPGDPSTTPAAVGPATSFGMPYDPPHEFADVTKQLYAPGARGDALTMGGFAAAALGPAGSFPAAARVMEAFDHRQIPVFTALAREFAVFNYWYSSLPGPTWPNRFFVHAATSGGLADSPSTAQILTGFDFPKGTIYERLEAAKRRWRVYHDGLPQAAGVDWLRKYYISPFTDTFRDMDDFHTDAAAGDLPDYTFIEPCYDTGNNYLAGNSMHPMNDIRKGESLLKSVYETIRNSPRWDSTLLIVTFDEHGGFYDHVAPPAAVPSGDDQRYRNPLDAFKFDQLGVRVPALLVSAYTQAGSVIGQEPSVAFDHTSILRTVAARFGLPSLTERDAAANSLQVALNVAQPRMDAPTTLPSPLTDAEAQALGTPAVTHVVPPDARLSDNQQSLVDLALRCNLDMAHPNLHPELVAEHATVRTQADAADYLDRHEAVVETQRR
jgi:phospholipase C